MQEQFWYKFGMYSAVTLRVFLYALAIFGIVYQSWNREIPYGPLAFLFAFLAWSRTVGVYEGTLLLVKNMKAPVVNQNLNFDSKDLEDAVNAVMFKNMYGGSPN